MRATRRFDFGTILSALLLVASIALGVLWQAQGRAHQRMDIGTASDDGAALNFHEAETSTSDPSLTFRWSSDSSEVRLWGLGHDTPAIVSLRMFPPEGEPRRVTLSAGDQRLGDVSLIPGPRVYRALLRAPAERDRVRRAVQRAP